MADKANGALVSSNTGGFLQTVFHSEKESGSRVVITADQMRFSPIQIYLRDPNGVIDVTVSFDDLYNALLPLVKREQKPRRQKRAM